MKVYSIEQEDDECAVFVQVELPGFQLTMLKVNHYSVEEDYEILVPEVVFSILPESFHTVTEDSDETDQEEVKPLLMEHDSTISVLDGQDLRLHRIVNLLDPVQFTYRSSPGGQTNTFQFSIETMNDSTGQKQNSGHYCMTVKDKTGETDPALAIREIHVT